MLDFLWTPIIVFSLLAYVAFNIFRYKHFDYKDEGKNLFLFILIRVIVIGILVAFLCLSFNGYVFYNQMKLFFFFTTLTAITVEEFLFSFLDGDLDYFFIFGIFIFGLFFIFINCPIGFTVYHSSREEVDPIVTKYDIVTSNDSNSNIFSIEGYRTEDEYHYSFYYMLKDGQMVHEDIKEKELDGVIINDDKAYFQKKEKMFIDKEQINKVPYNVGVDYSIYAPISAFHGEFSDNFKEKD